LDITLSLVQRKSWKKTFVKMSTIFSSLCTSNASMVLSRTFSLKKLCSSGSWDNCVCACVCVYIWSPSSSALHSVLHDFNPIETPNNLGTTTSIVFAIVHGKKPTAPSTYTVSSIEETCFVGKSSRASPSDTDTLTSLADDSNYRRLKPEP